MNILPCSSIDITNFIGALLINENGGEFYCTRIKFSLNDNVILVELSKERGGQPYASIPFKNLNKHNWSVQF